MRLLSLLPALISLCVSAAAWGDIYKWTDERGRTVLSNIPPTPADKARNVELVKKENKPALAPAAAHVATPTEQALLARIESLERQLQAVRSAPQAVTPPPMPYAGTYAPPPPPPGYYGGAYPTAYPGTYYPYPPVPAYPYVVYPVRTFISQPVFVTSGRSFHRGGGHRGRR